MFDYKGFSSLPWWYQLSFIDFENDYDSDEDPNYDPNQDNYDYTESEDESD